jgi:hypothetical protein
MAGHQCYHCKQWIAEGDDHDCWTTTEAALTHDLNEDLREAWERLRDEAVALGDQRIYASHHSIMFSRASCHFFVRPKRTFLELCVFLGREVRAPQVRRAVRSSAAKVAHLIPIRHRDEVEAPLTDWLREAYELSDAARRPGRAAPRASTASTGAAKPAKATRSVKKTTPVAAATRKRAATQKATATRKAVTAKKAGAKRGKAATQGQRTPDASTPRSSATKKARPR